MDLLARIAEQLTEQTWSLVPATVCHMAKEAQEPARKYATRYAKVPGPLYLSWPDAQPRPYPEPDGRTWFLVKRAADDFLRPVADAFSFAQRPLGGAHPLATSLVGGLLGSGIGYGTGKLIEQILPERYFRKGRVSRTGAVLGGLAGVSPGLIWGAADMQHPHDTGGGLQSWVSGWPFSTHEKLSSERNWTGALAIPSIPVDAFNRAVWSDVLQPQTAMGTRSAFGDNEQPLRTPPWAAATASGLVAGAGALTGQEMVSPLDVGLAAATAAGKGLIAGKAFGSVLGALAGLRPEAQARLQELGLWGGLLTGAVQRLFS